MESTKWIGETARPRAARSRAAQPSFTGGSPGRPAQRVEGSLEPFANVDRRRVVQELARCPNVGERITDIARARGAVFRGEARPGKLTNRPQELIERRLLPASDVHDLPRQLSRGVRREEVGANGVVDVAKITRLLAVAENDGALRPNRSRDELGHHGGVFALRVLARPEHIEV